MIARRLALPAGFALLLASPAFGQAQAGMDAAHQDGTQTGKAMRSEASSLPDQQPTSDTIPGFQGVPQDLGNLFGRDDDALNAAAGNAASVEEYGTVRQGDANKSRINASELASIRQRGDEVNGEPGAYALGVDASGERGVCREITTAAASSDFYEATCNLGAKVAEETRSCAVPLTHDFAAGYRYTCTRISAGSQVIGDGCASFTAPVCTTRVTSSRTLQAAAGASPAVIEDTLEADCTSQLNPQVWGGSFTAAAPNETLTCSAPVVADYSASWKYACNTGWDGSAYGSPLCAVYAPFVDSGLCQRTVTPVEVNICIDGFGCSTTYLWDNWDLTCASELTNAAGLVARGGVTASVDDSQCQALTSGKTCTLASESCIDSAPQTRLVDGVEVTQSCWGWSRSYQCTTPLTPDQCMAQTGSADCTVTPSVSYVGPINVYRGSQMDESACQAAISNQTCTPAPTTTSYNYQCNTLYDGSQSGGSPICSTFEPYVASGTCRKTVTPVSFPVCIPDFGIGCFDISYETWALACTSKLPVTAGYVGETTGTSLGGPTCVPNPTSITCNVAEEICVDEAPQTRVINGVAITQACWAWQRTYSCGAISQVSDCDELANNPQCSFLRDECLDEDPSGGACKTTERVYKCPVPSTAAPGPKEYVCGGDIYCVNGVCQEIERDASDELKDALIAMGALDQVQKEFDPDSLSLFKGSRETCHQPVFGLVNCCAGKVSGALTTAAGLSALAGGPAALAAVATQFLTVFLCSTQEKMLDVKDRMGLCHYVGSYCSSSFLGICKTKRKAYCCFQSKLTRILQEQGRPQINKPWGTPKREQCAGFTVDEFSRLDLSRMDFSEIYAEFLEAAKLPDEAQMAAEIQAKIRAYYQQNAGDTGGN